MKRHLTVWRRADMRRFGSLALAGPSYLLASLVAAARQATFSVAADPHVQPRTLRSAPLSGLVMLASRRATSVASKAPIAYGELVTHEYLPK